MNSGHRRPPRQFGQEAGEGLGPPRGGADGDGLKPAGPCGRRRRDGLLRQGGRDRRPPPALREQADLLEELLLQDRGVGLVVRPVRLADEVEGPPRQPFHRDRRPAFGERADEQHAHRGQVGTGGVQLADVAQRFQSAPARHVQVQGHQVGGRIADEIDRLLAAPHGTHHADTRVPLQRLLQGRAEDAGVVDDQDPQRFGIHAARGVFRGDLEPSDQSSQFLAELVELIGRGVDPGGRLVGRPGRVADAVDVGGDAAGGLRRLADVPGDVGRPPGRLGHVAGHVSRRLGHLGDRAGDVADALVRLRRRSARSWPPPASASPPTSRFYRTRR